MIDSRVQRRMEQAKAYYEGRVDMIGDILQMLSEMKVQDQVADLFFRAGESDKDDNTGAKPE